MSAFTEYAHKLFPRKFSLYSIDRKLCLGVVLKESICFDFLHTSFLPTEGNWYLCMLWTYWRKLVYFDDFELLKQPGIVLSFESAVVLYVTKIMHPIPEYLSRFKNKKKNPKLLTHTRIFQWPFREGPILYVIKVIDLVSNWDFSAPWFSDISFRITIIFKHFIEANHS